MARSEHKLGTFEFCFEFDVCLNLKFETNPRGQNLLQNETEVIFRNPREMKALDFVFYFPHTVGPSVVPQRVLLGQSPLGCLLGFLQFTEKHLTAAMVLTKGRISLVMYKCWEIVRFIISPWFGSCLQFLCQKALFQLLQTNHEARCTLMKQKMSYKTAWTWSFSW